MRAIFLMSCLLFCALPGVAQEKAAAPAQTEQEKFGMPDQPTVRRTGGTDAAAAYPHWYGCPAIVFGVPVRYIHSHNGILDDRDLESCIDLACALVRSVSK